MARRIVKICQKCPYFHVVYKMQYDDGEENQTSCVEGKNLIPLMWCFDDSVKTDFQWKRMEPPEQCPYFVELSMAGWNRNPTYKKKETVVECDAKKT